MTWDKEREITDGQLTRKRKANCNLCNSIHADFVSQPPQIPTCLRIFTAAVNAAWSASPSLHLTGSFSSFTSVGTCSLLKLSVPEEFPLCPLYHTRPLSIIFVILYLFETYFPLTCNLFTDSVSHKSRSSIRAGAISVLFNRAHSIFYPQEHLLLCRGHSENSG